VLQVSLVAQVGGIENFDRRGCVSVRNAFFLCLFDLDSRYLLIVKQIDRVKRVMFVDKKKCSIGSNKKIFVIHLLSILIAHAS
jgi:hypothetical protein